MDNKNLEAMKQAPVSAAEPHAASRQQRRAQARARMKRPLPAKIWRIVSVVGGRSAHADIRVFRIRIKQPQSFETVLVHSKEGEAPVVNGLLERTNLRGGEAFSWTNAEAEKSSIGGGYTRDAVPDDWKAELDAVEANANVVLSGKIAGFDLSTPLFSSPEFRAATPEEFAENVRNIGVAGFEGIVPLGSPNAEIVVSDGVVKIVKGDR